MRELIVDSFAGGGGASTGIELALGRSPDIAINHDGVALAMHAVNHPATKHLPHNIWKVDPTAVCDGRPVGLLWASPDCKHFSKAKGGKPVEKRIRDLAWVVVRWAKQVSPRVIMLENVEEFADWGPVLEDGKPCPERKGLHFRRFVGELRKLGYKVEYRELRACDYGSPTVRKRLFLIARRDGLPILWPKPTHGSPESPAVKAGKLLPWRTAAEIIDWSLVCPSIFATSAEIMAQYGLRAIRPLADATMARIAKGVQRYVLDAAEPFIVPITHTGDTRTYPIDEPARTVTTAHRGEQALVTPFVSPVKTWGGGGNDPRPADDPLRTTTTSKRGEHALVTPFVTKFRKKSTGQNVTEPLCTITTSHSDTHPGGSPPMGVVAPIMIQTGYGERPGQAPRTLDLHKPTGTAVDGCKQALVSSFLAKHYGDTGQRPGSDMREPVATITSSDHHAVVSAGLVNLKGADRRHSAPTEPTPTQTAGGWHQAEVRAFLIRYFGTQQTPELGAPLPTSTTKERDAIVYVQGEPYEIVDIGMRMLTPRELFRAQGFPDGYIIDRTADGTPISKTDQIRMCGNSVCPDVAAALVTTNYTELEVTERGIPAFALVAAE